LSDGPAQLPRLSRVAAYAACTDGDAILLCRIAPGFTSRYDGYWTLPGGGIDFGEHPRAAVLRELAEEAGLTGRAVELLDVGSWTDRFTDPADGVTKDFHAVRVLYRVEVTGGDLRDEVGGSSDTCRWVRREELADLPTVDLVDWALAAIDRR
jgi:8-oxo-dGTP diphosphatase